MLSATKGLQRGFKDGLQPETLADGNWLVKQNQPVSKIETSCLFKIKTSKLVDDLLQQKGLGC